MDIRDLIQKADAYGKESQAQQQQIEEGLWDDLVGKIADVAKNLGIPPETADRVANAISTQPEAEEEVNAVDPEAGGETPTVASGSGVSPDAAGETQDLMTRYNAGGKKAMPEIEKLQQDLKDLGFDPNGVDGKYGNGTFKAVQEFQKANGLQADGQAGKDTLAKIEQVKSGGGQAGGTGATASGDQGDGTRGGTAGAQPDAETQAIIDELNALLQQMGEPAAPPATGGDPEIIATSADQDQISFMRGAINLAESLLFEATPEQIAKVDELLGKLQGTQWAKDNADAMQQYVDRTTRAKATTSTPNASTAAAAGRADAADAGGATDAERAAGAGAAKAGVDGPADATAAAAQGGDAATSTPNATTAAAAGRADAADAGGATDAEKAAGAGQAQPAAPKVGKEVYVQMGSNGPSTANFNVAQMKKKYPKPYVDIPAKDGTVTRGYGAPETLQAYVKKNPQAKIVGAGDAGGQPVVTSRQFDQEPIQEGASMNVTADNAAELAELLGILKNAGMPDAAPVADMHMPEPQGPMPCATCGGDHEPGPCGGEEWDNSPDEGYGDMMDIIKLSGGPNSNKNPGDIRVKDPRQNDEEVEEDGWDNSPDEEYKDDDYMYQSGGIHKKKKSHPPVAGGDNPMALENSIKAQLYKALEEKLQNK